MKHGKIVHRPAHSLGCLGLINTERATDPLEGVRDSRAHATPCEVRQGGFGWPTYQGRMEVRAERETAMALRWLVKFFTGSQTAAAMSQKLAG